MSSSLLCCWFLLLFITIHAADGFENYVVGLCEFTSPELKDIEYIRSEFYNKEELFRFTSSLGKFVGFTDYGIFQAEYRNNDTVLIQALRAEKERYCQHNIGIFYSNALTKSVEPYVRIHLVAPSSGGHPARLVCSAFSFYPKTIKVSWLRNGEEITSGVDITDELPDGDWYYQVHSNLEYKPRSGEKISCRVEHASLKEPLITDWEPQSQDGKIAGGASGLVLGLVFGLAGFLYYKRKLRGSILVPNR
ncbi:rano class II histocompatibility antigen, A beta chain-like [Cyprinodon tularosa]|uniref:rano class II histocompatibility antigen, A beta chain-like n=1 Tax=Cyprinodon tularosa TaxID=77115 RepID=UPI0018E22D53|nr:rano class II histocompatibility antigen, A beta chain-like [Cyprinodon tularosa]